MRSLEGLKVAPFYGCQILRPSKLLGFEDPDRPQSLERLIEACGAEPIDYPAKIKCCGFPIVLAREDVALGEAIQPLAARPTDAGADVMVTPCPLCHLSLDAWQEKAEKKAGREFNMPILHLAQLLGAAAGIDEDELKFKRHVVRLVGRREVQAAAAVRAPRPTPAVTDRRTALPPAARRVQSALEDLGLHARVVAGRGQRAHGGGGGRGRRAPSSGRS